MHLMMFWVQHSFFQTRKTKYWSFIWLDFFQWVFYYFQCLVHQKPFAASFWVCNNKQDLIYYFWIRISIHQLLGPSFWHFEFNHLENTTNLWIQLSICALSYYKVYIISWIIYFICILLYNVEVRNSVFLRNYY